MNVRRPAPPTHAEYQHLNEILIEVRTRLEVLIEETRSVRSDHENRIRALEQKVDPPDEAQTEMLEKFDARLSALERWRWLITGLAAAGGSGLGAAAQALLGGG
jgi:hypothetical protein